MYNFECGTLQIEFFYNGFAQTKSENEFKTEECRSAYVLLYINNKTL